MQWISNDFNNADNLMQLLEHTLEICNFNHFVVLFHVNTKMFHYYEYKQS